jgi:hypothetical protein
MDIAKTYGVKWTPERRRQDMYGRVPFLFVFWLMRCLV